ncbi:MAG: GTP cyclohydrolase II [bacterium]
MDHAPFFARTTLPTAHGDFDVRVFLDEDKEHLSLSVGALDGAEEVLVRVHSECLTSEVFGSLKCDCKAQLDFALDAIQAEGRGVVLYLRQEGRGIGLGNKIRAYALQEPGADTVDANRLLGFGDDLRRYDVAVETIRALGIRSVRLLTNNPLKIEALEEAGINVSGREAVFTGLNPVNQNYLETKRVRMGHLYGRVKLSA